MNKNQKLGQIHKFFTFIVFRLKTLSINSTNESYGKQKRKKITQVRHWSIGVAFTREQQ